MSPFEAAILGGRYRVIRRLGSGGTAAVYLTVDERLGREVAVKRLHGAEVTAETAQRLQREARIMASLRHSHLVTVYDMLTDEDDLLLVMEYIAGQTLADVLADAPLDWERTLELLEPVAQALDYAHERGVVHRDVKPANVLVGANGAIKVADLGLATAAEITRITPPGAIVGTPAYMAPEQARAGPCSGAVDVFALATIAFQALSGSVPRAGSTVIAVLAQATSEPRPDLRDRRPATPAAVAEALMRGMSPDADERQATACQLLEEIAVGFRAAATRGRAASDYERRPSRAAPKRGEPRPPRHAPRRRARLLAFAALAVAAAAVVAILATTLADHPAAPSARGEHATPTGTPPRTATPGSVPERELSPTATVRAFYSRAAAGDLAAAWKLAGPSMRGAYDNSFTRFRRELSSLRRIEFQRLAVIGRDSRSVTLDIQTVATHTDRVDRCTGTVRTIRGDGGRWVIEPAGVQCTTG
jgi:serine/threonine protein kinase